MFLMFFIIFLLMCGLFYGYSYWKIIRGFRGRLWLKLLLAGVALALVAMPMGGMWLERRGHFNLAWPLAVIGFVALPAAGWYAALALVTDLWNLIVRTTGWLLAKLRHRPVASSDPVTGAQAERRPLQWALLPPGWTALVIGIIVTVAVTVGLYQAHHIRMQEVVVAVPQLPEGRGELVVAQVSDLHLGLNERGPRMRQVIDILERTKPDIILFTGDIIDSPLEHVNSYAPQFALVQAPLGKYAVLGNHEFYVARGALPTGVPQWFKDAGFRLLRQASVRVADGVVVAGVDDPARGLNGTRSNERMALADVRDDDLVLFLKHQPLAGDYGAGRVMVQFSGHAHGGQLWPWHYISQTQYPMLQGLFELAPGRYLYANPGAGTWGPPVRLFADPEVTIMRFRKG